MRRRDLLTLVANAAISWPLRSVAQQQPKVYHIDLLASGFKKGGIFERDAFWQAFRDAGYVKGRNLVTDERFAEANFSQLPVLATELVELRVDVIVTVGGPAAQAAKRATSTIPIVLMGAGDPVGTGLVASMARPGGNITGVTEFSTTLSGKRLQLLKDAVPGIVRVAVLYNASDSAMVLRYRMIEDAAPTLDVVIQPLGVREPADFGGAFTAMVANRPDAIIMVTDALTTLNRKKVIAFAAENHLPLAAEFSNIVRDGALMSYGWSLRDFYPRVVYFVKRVLRGDKPADLPIEGPTRFYLTINMKTAATLGLTIPKSILARADEVIE